VALGAALGGLARKGRDKITFVTSERLSSFGAWAEQLLAESTGKEGTGLVPVDGEVLGPPDVYGSDRVFVYLRTAEEENGTVARKLEALEQHGHPVIRLVLPDVTALGAEFYRWELATATAGHILGIDAFDQPDVEAAKRRTREILATWMESGTGGQKSRPTAEDERIAVYQPGVQPGDDGPEALLHHMVQGAKDGDYLALLAYMHRTPERIRRLQELRRVLRDRLGIATTLGFGPRYLHSTGQLHKGGPDSGLFLVISIEDPEDLAIEGKSYGFATLHRAQALGDVQALEDAGRRVVRIHLKDGVEEGLDHLAAFLETARTPEPAGA
jgi:transaldolase/glucose-6-phosphate isomerase